MAIIVRALVAVAMLFVSFSVASASDFYLKYNSHSAVMTNQIHGESGRPESFKGLISKETCLKNAKASDAKAVCKNGASFKLSERDTRSCTLAKGKGSDGTFIMMNFIPGSFNAATRTVTTYCFGTLKF